jgi:hypothetical protein
MAMFDLKDSGPVNLIDCKTTSETMLKAQGTLTSLTAERCEATQPLDTIPTKQGFWLRIGRSLAAHAMTIVTGLILAAIVAYFGWN